MIFYFVPIYSTSPPHPTNQIIAAVVCDMNELAARISSQAEESPDAAVLMYSGGIVSSTRPITENETELLAHIDRNRGGVTYGSTKYMTTKISMPEKYWDFIYFIPENALTSRALASMNQGLIPLCAVLLLISVFLALILRSVNRSIQFIAGDMNALSYKSENPKYNHIREPGLTELRAISSSANRMLDRLRQAFLHEHETQEQLYRAMNAQSEAEMMGYRSQINPHFLFNTLECMRSMAHNKGHRDMETIISSMAIMFRYSLHSETFVPFSQELSHVRNYINVMCIRFPGRYTLLTDIDQSLLDRTVLSMVLQPIVENSVMHGFTGREGKCLISIKAYENDKKSLVVRIADNGEGLSPGELDSLNSRMRRSDDEPSEGRSSIGLNNIFKRMKLTFGSHFHIRFYSRKGYYTVVELTIPEAPELNPEETLEPCGRGGKDA